MGHDEGSGGGRQRPGGGRGSGAGRKGAGRGGGGGSGGGSGHHYRHLDDAGARRLDRHGQCHETAGRRAESPSAPSPSTAETGSARPSAGDRMPALTATPPLGAMPPAAAMSPAAASLQSLTARPRPPRARKRALIARPEACTACGACVDACPRGAIEVADVAVIDAVFCTGCGACLDACPNDVIEIETRSP